MQLERQYTNEKELLQAITHDGPKLLEELRREVGSLEVEYALALKQRTKGMVFLILGFLLAPLLSLGPVTFVISMILSFYLVYKGLRNIIWSLYTITMFGRVVDSLLFARVFSLLNVSGQLINQPVMVDPRTLFTGLNRTSFLNFLELLKSKSVPEKESVLTELGNAELITEDHNTNVVDGIMNLEAGTTTVTVAELDIKHVTGSGKNRHIKQIFQGYFARLELTQELVGKTFVSTEGDNDGFGGITFWNKGSTNLPRETILEWNEFENMLHVATTNETEARYILTPNFMQDLYDWWKEQKTNIRIVFIKNHMYILFPDTKIRLGHGIIGDLTEESLVEYINTIARPLWHVIRLVEKVRL